MYICTLCLCVPVKFPNILCVVHVLEMLKITMLFFFSSLKAQVRHAPSNGRAQGVSRTDTRVS